MIFSIIIACYNLGRLVCKAIDSCVNQKNICKDDYEILVINDGSTDDTLKYIRHYQGVSNVKIIDKQNGGLSNTRNLGVKKANGDYILFLDGDDWLAEDALYVLKKYTGKYEVIDFPMVYYYDDKDQKTQNLDLVEGEYSRDEFLHITFGKGRFDIIPSPKKIYRRQFLLDNEITFVEGILHEDGPFFLKVLNHCKTIYEVQKPLYYYLQKRNGSITSQQTRKNFDGIMAGIDYIDKLDISHNRDVCLRNGHVMVYQVTQVYKNINDYNYAVKELSTLGNKKRIFRYLIHSTFEIKHFLRLLLLLLNPSLLGFLYRRR